MNWAVRARTLLRVPADGGSGTVGGNHYNEEDHPRVPKGDPSGHGGEWTSSGKTETRDHIDARATLPALALGEEALPAVVTGLLRQALANLIRVGSGPVALLGGLLIPTDNESRIVDGVVEGAEHIRYHYDEGFLTLERLDRYGGTEILFHGHHDPNGYFISVDGDVLARDMGAAAGHSNGHPWRCAESADDDRASARMGSGTQRGQV